MKSLKRKLFMFCYLFSFFMLLNAGYSIARDNSLARIKRIALLKKPEPEIIEKPQFLVADKEQRILTPRILLGVIIALEALHIGLDYWESVYKWLITI